ncbi:hypothetical protein Syun_003992 [Stephania yunnanensis]|uniref:Uncharacterized protein n=1 Tax=Stephania yunnanensis TaxID=152371 RepID=A0AAP0Q123_9MAGN
MKGKDQGLNEKKPIHKHGCKGKTKAFKRKTYKRRMNSIYKCELLEQIIVDVNYYMCSSRI